MTTTETTQIELTDGQLDTLHDALITSIDAQVALVKSWKGVNGRRENVAAEQLQRTMQLAYALCRVAPWMVGLKEVADNITLRRTMRGLTVD